MVQSRTVRVLAALLIAMALGAFALMVLETNPIGSQSNLAVLSKPGEAHNYSVVFETDVPLQPIKWRNIIVHASVAGGVADRCHFVIRPGAGGGDAVAIGTQLWKRQAESYHVTVPGRDWNADSVGICLMGDFSRRAPSSGQYSALVQLVQTLQSYFSISTDRVYLYRDLDSRTDSPGTAFPADDFWMRLQ